MSAPHVCDCGRPFASEGSLAAHTRRCVAFERGAASRRVAELLREAAARTSSSGDAAARPTADGDVDRGTRPPSSAP